MSTIKGSYRNPNEGYEAAVTKGSIRKPPVEKPAYEIETAYIKGSVRKPPVKGLAHEQVEPYLVSIGTETGIENRI